MPFIVHRLCWCDETPPVHSLLYKSERHICHRQAHRPLPLPFISQFTKKVKNKLAGNMKSMKYWSFCNATVRPRLFQNVGICCGDAMYEISWEFSFLGKCFSLTASVLQSGVRCTLRCF